MVTGIAIPSEAQFKSRVMLALPVVFPVGCWVVFEVWLTPVTDAVPTVEELDRSCPDPNINGRSIPNKK